MVGRYVFSVCSCVLHDLHKKGIDYVTLPSSVIINNYHDLRKTYSCRTGLHHRYGSIYCKRHEEQLLKFFSYEVCRSATERCPCVSRGNCITACIRHSSMSRNEMELLFSVSYVNCIDGWKLFNAEIT